MKYKFNDYLLVAQDDNQDIIFYDTLNYHTVLIKKEDYNIFNDFRMQILSNGNYSGPRQNMDLFLEHNIIRSMGDSVHEQLQKRYNEVINGKRILSLIILPTEQCNFRCIYCYEDYKLGKMNEATVDKIIQLLEKLISEYDILNLAWFGGEPLLALDVIGLISEKAASLCKKYKKAYYSQITTNGYLLSLDIMNELLRMHTMVFQITLDGDRDSHNKQRYLADGSGTYDVILNNLLMIKRHIKTTTIKIIVRINVSKDMNADEINDLAKIFSDDDRFVINIQKIFGDSSTEKVDDDDYRNYLDIFDKCHKNIMDDLTVDSTMCYAAKKSTLMIRSDGTLGKCTVNFEDPNNNFGNITNIDLSTFSLDSIEYCNCTHIKEKCIACCIYPLCFGRQCPAKRYQLCKNMIDKYNLVIKSYSSKAHILELI